jgi:tetratricopeptide (TPR) repeat protein
MIKDRPDLPEDLTVAFDLEMARSLQIAAIKTPNTDLQAKYVLDAQAALDKFLKEHADHSEAGSAQMTSGEISLFRAQSALKIGMRDKTKRDTMLPEARKLLDEARPKYEKAVVMFKARVEEVRAENGAGGKKKTLTKRAARAAAEALNNWYDARFKVATVDYNMGMSFPEPKDPKRKDFLTKAAKGFDVIYQENRSGRTGVYAHMWEGRAREEMEDFVTAMDIYDEVMSASPDKSVNLKTEAQWIAMFNEVNRYRLMLLGRMKQYDKLIDDAKAWLAQNESKRKTSGYQGIKLELAKGLLEYAKTAKGAEAEEAIKFAKRYLAEIKEVPSESSRTKRSDCIVKEGATKN